MQVTKTRYKDPQCKPDTIFGKVIKDEFTCDCNGCLACNRERNRIRIANGLPVLERPMGSTVKGKPVSTITLLADMARIRASIATSTHVIEASHGPSNVPAPMTAKAPITLTGTRLRSITLTDAGRMLVNPYGPRFDATSAIAAIKAAIAGRK